MENHEIIDILESLLQAYYDNKPDKALEKYTRDDIMDALAIAKVKLGRLR